MVEHQRVEDHLGLVHSVARSVGGRLSNEDFDDDLQEGVIGLMRAIELYDPEKGFAFSTYASGWIRNAIHRGRARRRNVPMAVYGTGVRDRYDRSLDAPSFGSTDADPLSLVGVIPDGGLTAEPTDDRDTLVARAVASLNEKDRIAVLEFTDDAAHALGIAERSVLRRRVRAYGKIRTALASEVQAS